MNITTFSVDGVPTFLVTRSDASDYADISASTVPTFFSRLMTVAYIRTHSPNLE